MNQEIPDNYKDLKVKHEALMGDYLELSSELNGLRNFFGQLMLAASHSKANISLTLGCFLSFQRKARKRKMSPKRGKFVATLGPSLRSLFQSICLGSMSIWMSQIMKNLFKLLRSHVGIQDRHLRKASYQASRIIG